MEIITNEQYEAYYTNLQSQAFNLGYKLRGLAYLFSNFQTGDFESDYEDRESMIGVSILIEHLRDDAMDMYRKLDCAKRPSLQPEECPLCSLNKTKVYSTMRAKSAKSEEKWKAKLTSEEGLNH